MTVLVCERCGKPFERTNLKGPVPRFCKVSCRQRAYEARRGMKQNVVWLAELPKRAKEAREERGISLKTAVEEMGLSSTSILWRFENLERATFDQIIKIAHWTERQSW